MDTTRSWPHQPTTPQPTITLTTYQAQRLLRSLASGFTSTDELTWLAEQLGPDHIAHPTEPPPTIDRILTLIHAQATQDQDLYRRGYNAGRADGETIARDATWAEGYNTGYQHAQAGNKPCPHPPDSAGHDEIAML